MQTLMKIERLVFACIIVVAGSFVAMNALAEKEIFKTVDADGNVVFTDVPPRAEETAEKVDLVAPNSFTPDQGVGPAAGGRELWIEDPATGSEDAELAPSPGYRSLTISMPADQANVRENTGNVSVVAELEPELAPGHSLRLLLDDIPSASAGEDATFALSNVDRGTHTLRAEVLDREGAVVFAGEQSVFHLQRYSKLTAPNRRPPPKKKRPSSS